MHGSRRRRQISDLRFKHRFLLDPIASPGGGSVSTAPASDPIGSVSAPADGGQATRGDDIFNPGLTTPTPTQPAAGTGAGVQGAASGQPASPGVAAPGAGGAGGAGGQAPRPADPNQAAGVQPAATQQQTAQPAQPQYTGIRQVAQQFGLDVSQFADDGSFFNHLLQQAGQNRQADYYAQLGRQLAPHAQGIQGYFAQQQQQQAAPQAAPSWQAPEFDERWAALVERDPATGIYLPRPGAPPEVAAKVNAYVEWKKKFDLNPASVLNGMVESRASEIARQQVAEQFAVHNRNQAISEIASANTPWLYQRDAAGRQVTNPVTGQRAVTPVGAAYLSNLQVLQRSGVTDPRTQDQLAQQLTRAQFAQGGGQQTPAAQFQQQQATNAPNQNPLQALAGLERANTPGATEPSATGMGLSEMLRQAMAANGVTDNDFAFLAEGA